MPELKLYSMTMETDDVESGSKSIYHHVGVALSDQEAWVQAINTVKALHPQLYALAQRNNGFKINSTLTFTYTQIIQYFNAYQQVEKLENFWSPSYFESMQNQPIIAEATPAQLYTKQEVGVISRMMQHITENRDLVCFRAIKPYLNEREIKLIEEKISYAGIRLDTDS